MSYQKQKMVLSFILLNSMVLPAPFLSAAAVEMAPQSQARVYPNPWRADQHQHMSVTFDNLAAASQIKLFTVSAREVRTLVADSRGMAAWDCRNSSGDSVASGIYLYLITDPHGNKTEGKLAIIK